MRVNVLDGEAISLKPLIEAEAEQICAWRNNPDISRFFHRKHIEPDTYIEWMREVSGDPDQGLYAVTEKDGGRLLGTLAFKLNRSGDGNASATLGIMIGDPACRGKGFGEEAMEIVSKDLAERFGIVKTIVEVLPENKSAIAFYEKLGYAQEMIVMTKKV